MNYYAGIGSRRTPEQVLLVMTELALRLSRFDLTLRSGGAPGADTAFAVGATKAQIFLPWQGFNGIQSPFCKPTEAAEKLAASVHPAWDRCSQGARKLHARNSHQILGPNLDEPCKFVVCWTPDGCESGSARSYGTGGTGQAIQIASEHGIPVINMANCGWGARLETLVTSLEALK